MDRLSLDKKSSSTDSKVSVISEKSLKDWKLPSSSASDIYNRTGFFSKVRTVEKEIRISEAYSSYPLFSKLFTKFYQNFFRSLHVGMIQVALKPSMIGSNTSAIIYLCDKRLTDEYSVLKMVNSSLGEGPIYFSYFPTYSVALRDAHHTFTIDIEIEESNMYVRGGESIILMYRIHYEKTNAFFPNLKNMNNGLVAQSNPPSSEREESAAANARVDWKETAEAHVLKVDVPGLKKEEVKVEVEDDGRTLKISGERGKEEENDDMWHCVERSSGKFLRRVMLPENAKLDEVKAAMENGLLTVTVPTEKVKKKTEVKVIEISG